MKEEGGSSPWGPSGLYQGHVLVETKGLFNRPLEGMSRVSLCDLTRAWEWLTKQKSFAISFLLFRSSERIVQISLSSGLVNVAFNSTRRSNSLRIAQYFAYSRIIAGILIAEPASMQAACVRRQLVHFASIDLRAGDTLAGSASPFVGSIPVLNG